MSAEYFRGGTPDPHNRVLARIEPNIDARWGFGSPDPAVPVDQFAARWTGTIEPRFSELYTLSLPRVDDTARVLIDGVVVIDHAGWFAPTSGTVALQAGHAHAIVVEYAEAWGVAELALAWQSASQAFEIVPSAQLTPAPTPPAQPATGPGGQACDARLRVRRHVVRARAAHARHLERRHRHGARDGRDRRQAGVSGGQHGDRLRALSGRRGSRSARCGRFVLGDP